MADLPATPKLKVVTTPGGAKFSVAEEYAPRFQAFVNELAKTYNIDPATSGGYNQRYIAGTQTPSEHAYGRAIDVDWNENPQGGKSFKIDPTTARTLASKYGLTWGGDWQGSTADPMHFQVNQGVAWDPQNGAVPNTQYASSANAINTVASPALTTSPGSATPASTNANNVTPATPAANQNTNAPAVTPTSSDAVPGRRYEHHGHPAPATGCDARCAAVRDSGDSACARAHAHAPTGRRIRDTAPATGRHNRSATRRCRESHTGKPGCRGRLRPADPGHGHAQGARDPATAGRRHD
jgi:hypothetical protein